LSKLSQLKQKAYKAGKDRDWEQAISVYEQILELEKSNPTVINELGDLWLKSGDTRQAIKHFLSAATKYRKTGLLNNSVAICKKILRHDETNLHAHWYLAEIRSSQDLLVEGEAHATAFLNGGEKASGEIQEIYLKRCGTLLELYPASLGIMDRLVKIFRTYDLPLESGRAGLLKAGVVYDSGDKDTAQALVDGILAASPELKNYSEFEKWNKRVNPDAAGSAPQADYNSVDLTDNPEAPEIPDTPAAVETTFSDISIDIPEVTAEVAAPESTATNTVDDDGCQVIDTDDGSDMADLLAEASRELSGIDDVALDESSPESDPEESIDLLAQILSEESGAGQGDQAKQVDTIAAEIGNLVGGEGEDEDPARLYEMGMVYLEMGLFDKASESFEIAAVDDEYTIRAHEMWGITLQRAERPDEAIVVLTSGLQFAEMNSRENLGLRYHIARAHEMADRPDTAVGIYEEILAVAPNFLDINTRLSQLSSV
jgi:tetratricopeptide (TPR) repeat protein